MLAVGSLFSGAGGFDLGFERAGLTVRWQSEIDKHASTVLRHHWPKVRNYGDITTTRRLPAVDVVCGGFPCQDVSVAGRRAGLAGERSGLWWEFRRVLAEVRPAWVVIENVPGLLSSNRGNDMGTVLWSLGQLGYWWAYRILDAQWFGVAQRRKRVFIVGHLGDRRAPATVLLEPESREGHPPPGRAQGQEVAHGIRASTHSGRADDPDRMTFLPMAIRTANTNANGHGVAEDVAHTLDGAQGQAVWPATVAPTLNTHFGDKMGLEDQHALHGAGLFVPAAFDVRQITSKDNRSSIAPGKPVPTLNADGGMHIAFSAKDYGGDAGDVSPTLRAMPHDQSHANGGGQVAVMTSMAVRRLTPRECERLQGFPDDWTLVDGMSDSARYRMMGNAVAVPVAEWIGRRIVEMEASR